MEVMTKLELSECEVHQALAVVCAPCQAGPLRQSITFILIWSIMKIPPIGCSRLKCGFLPSPLSGGGGVNSKWVRRHILKHN
jgi:hypothetical protein